MIPRSGRGPVATPILPLTTFHLAEDYHQKWRLRQTPLFAEYVAHYPRMADLLQSIAATKANAYVAGHGRLEHVTRDIDSLGLSDDAKRHLLRLRRLR